MRFVLFAFLLSLLLLFTSSEAAAQRYIAGMKIGVAVTRLSGGNATSLDPSSTLAGGGAFGFDFGNGLIVQAEILYLRKGAYADVRAVIDGEELLGRARFDLTYLEVPLLLKYRLETSGRIHPMIFAGPAVAANVDARIRFTPNAGSQEFDEGDDEAKGITFDGMIGAGFEYEVSGERLSLGARYMTSLTNARDPDPDPTSAVEEPSRINGVVVFLGLNF